MKASFYEAVIEEIIKPVLPKGMAEETRYLINPTGRFVIGGPQGDCGLTGRKIIVDTYGGACPHGGGAFSARTRQGGPLGGLRRALRREERGRRRPGQQCQIQVAYAIGVARLMNITVYTEGTGVIPTRRSPRTGRRALRPAPEGHHPDARPAAPDLRKTAAARFCRSSGAKLTSRQRSSAHRAVPEPTIHGEVAD